MFKLSEVQNKLREMNVSPKKSLGQNFLINDLICDKIVNAGLVHNPKSIFEIGPGLGALTEKLKASNLSLTLLELDSAFCEYWRSLNYNVIEGDALRLNWSELPIEKPALLISNLPYQISASLVIDRSIEVNGIDFMVLMFQKEVAQRIMANADTENYGFLSVIAQTFWDVSFLLEAGPKDFFPPPSIASRVLIFRRKAGLLGRPTKFLAIVKAAFSQRRKLVKKNLSQLYPIDVIERAFLEVKISLEARAENISPSQFVALLNFFER